MRYKALACDYDGTLAEHNQLEPDQISQLLKLQANGRKLLLVTGRLLEDLLVIIPDISIFDYVVCENGALLYEPRSRKETLIGQAPPERMLQLATERNVQPLYVGRSIVSTLVPWDKTMFDIIRELGIEWQVIFNNEAVMLLPPGVNKAFGLRAALKELGLSPHNCVAIGDAENDHAFLNQAEVGVAVGNAIPTLKENADMVTTGRVFEGVRELINKIVETDLASVQPALAKTELKLGTDDHDQIFRVKPYGSSLLIAGASGSGKSTVAHALLERLTEKKYQFCLIDPEGDYEKLDNSVSLGDPKNIPSINEILQILRNPSESVVVNLLGVPLADRPKYFHALLPHLHTFYTETGRPHWLAIDEAHHLLPANISTSNLAMSELSGSTLLVTVHPDHVSPKALASVDTVLTIGRFPRETIRQFCGAIGELEPPAAIPESNNGNVIAWRRDQNTDPFVVHMVPAKQERQRHRRKYTQGDVGMEKSFVFRGPENRLKLRAQNLQIFMQMADGVDEDTFTYHLRKGDYSKWCKDAIKDEALASEMAAIENNQQLDAVQSLASVKAVIEKRYGGPE